MLIPPKGTYCRAMFEFGLACRLCWREIVRAFMEDWKGK